MVKNLGQQHSILNQYIAEIRDERVQQDSLRFRRNLERIGMFFGYRISETLVYEKKEITTTLGVAEVPVLTDYPVLATILRAGLPLHQGLLNVFDKSENAFISAYRMYHKDGRFSIQIEYSSTPDVEGKVVILSDSMLATGASMVLAYKELLTNGKPKHTHIISILASTEGVEYLKRSLPGSDITLWVGAIDEELTAQAYIVPGLGDAGDLAYGKKL
ncbi:MAG TPA: uracil phosphoribosyltransferase [Bacteroidales bacterium]|nr:uracil phosphoribosyltransferase [Bacteroidales bacterium]HSA43152.1 uracil phosphoribosyltransferase [Bacteroidales bacterium]